MIVRTIDEFRNTHREVHAHNGNWTSTRMLIASDGMGFSFHETIIHKGTETLIWYRNHLEAVYCIEGFGEIETTDDGKIYTVQPGTMYALDRHDRHFLRAHEMMRLVCVFNPPLRGDEVHDSEGVYPA
jgi:L-ectoine synthase